MVNFVAVYYAYSLTTNDPINIKVCKASLMSKYSCRTCLYRVGPQRLHKIVYWNQTKTYKFVLARDETNSHSPLGKKKSHNNYSNGFERKKNDYADNNGQRIFIVSSVVVYFFERTFFNRSGQVDRVLFCVLPPHHLTARTQEVGRVDSAIRLRTQYPFYM